MTKAGESWLYIHTLHNVYTVLVLFMAMILTSQWFACVFCVRSLQMNIYCCSIIQIHSDSGFYFNALDFLLRPNRTKRRFTLVYLSWSTLFLAYVYISNSLNFTHTHTFFWFSCIFDVGVLKPIFHFYTCIVLIAALPNTENCGFFPFLLIPSRVDYRMLAQQSKKRKWKTTHNFM